MDFRAILKLFLLLRTIHSVSCLPAALLIEQMKPQLTWRWPQLSGIFNKQQPSITTSPCCSKGWHYRRKIDQSNTYSRNYLWPRPPLMDNFSPVSGVLEKMTRFREGISRFSGAPPYKFQGPPIGAFDAEQNRNVMNKEVWKASQDARSTPRVSETASRGSNINNLESIAYVTTASAKYSGVTSNVDDYTGTATAKYVGSDEVSSLLSKPSWSSQKTFITNSAEQQEPVGLDKSTTVAAAAADPRKLLDLNIDGMAAAVTTNSPKINITGETSTGILEDSIQLIKHADEESDDSTSNGVPITVSPTTAVPEIDAEASVATNHETEPSGATSGPRFRVKLGPNTKLYSKDEYLRQTLLTLQLLSSNYDPEEENIDRDSSKPYPNIYVPVEHFYYTLTSDSNKITSTTEQTISEETDSITTTNPLSNEDYSFTSENAINTLFTDFTTTHTDITTKRSEELSTHFDHTTYASEAIENINEQASYFTTFTTLDVTTGGELSTFPEIFDQTTDIFEATESSTADSASSVTSYITTEISGDLSDITSAFTADFETSTISDSTTAMSDELPTYFETFDQTSYTSGTSENNDEQTTDFLITSNTIETSTADFVSNSISDMSTEISTYSEIFGQTTDSSGATELSTTAILSSTSTDIEASDNLSMYYEIFDETTDISGTTKNIDEQTTYFTSFTSSTTESSTTEFILSTTTDTSEGLFTYSENFDPTTDISETSFTGNTTQSSTTDFVSSTTSDSTTELLEELLMVSEIINQTADAISTSENYNTERTTTLFYDIDIRIDDDNDNANATATTLTTEISSSTSIDSPATTENVINTSLITVIESDESTTQTKIYDFTTESTTVEFSTENPTRATLDTQCYEGNIFSENNSCNPSTPDDGVSTTSINSIPEMISRTNSDISQDTTTRIEFTTNLHEATTLSATDETLYTTENFYATENNSFTSEYETITSSTVYFDTEATENNYDVFTTEVSTTLKEHTTESTPDFDVDLNTSTSDVFHEGSSAATISAHYAETDKTIFTDYDAQNTQRYESTSSSLFTTNNIFTIEDITETQITEVPKTTVGAFATDITNYGESNEMSTESTWITFSTEYSTDESTPAIIFTEKPDAIFQNTQATDSSTNIDAQTTLVSTITSDVYSGITINLISSTIAGITTETSTWTTDSLNLTTNVYETFEISTMQTQLATDHSSVTNLPFIFTTETEKSFSFEESSVKTTEIETSTYQFSTTAQEITAEPNTEEFLTNENIDTDWTTLQSTHGTVSAGNTETSTSITPETWSDSNIHSSLFIPNMEQLSTSIGQYEEGLSYSSSSITTEVGASTLNIILETTTLSSPTEKNTEIFETEKATPTVTETSTSHLTTEHIFETDSESAGVNFDDVEFSTSTNIPGILSTSLIPETSTIAVPESVTESESTTTELEINHSTTDNQVDNIPENITTNNMEDLQYTASSTYETSTNIVSNNLQGLDSTVSSISETATNVATNIVTENIPGNIPTLHTPETFRPTEIFNYTINETDFVNGVDIFFELTEYAPFNFSDEIWATPESTPKMSAKPTYSSVTENYSGIAFTSAEVINKVNVETQNETTAPSRTSESATLSATKGDLQLFTSQVQQHASEKDEKLAANQTPTTISIISSHTENNFVLFTSAIRGNGTSTNEKSHIENRTAFADKLFTSDAVSVVTSKTDASNFHLKNASSDDMIRNYSTSLLSKFVIIKKHIQRPETAAKTSDIIADPPTSIYKKILAKAVKTVSEIIYEDEQYAAGAGTISVRSGDSESTNATEIIPSTESDMFPESTVIENGNTLFPIESTTGSDSLNKEEFVETSSVFDFASESMQTTIKASPLNDISVTQGVGSDNTQKTAEDAYAPSVSIVALRTSKKLDNFEGFHGNYVTETDSPSTVQQTDAATIEDTTKYDTATDFYSVFYSEPAASFIFSEDRSMEANAKQDSPTSDFPSAMYTTTSAPTTYIEADFISTESARQYVKSTENNNADPSLHVTTDTEENLNAVTTLSEITAVATDNTLTTLEMEYDNQRGPLDEESSTLEAAESEIRLFSGISVTEEINSSAASVYMTNNTSPKESEFTTNIELDTNLIASGVNGKPKFTFDSENNSGQFRDAVTEVNVITSVSSVETRVRINKASFRKRFKNIFIAPTPKRRSDILIEEDGQDDFASFILEK